MALQRGTLDAMGREPDVRPGLRWRILVDGPRSGPANMALDHALARELAPGTAVFRAYRWSTPTISLGRNQPAAGLYDRDAAAKEGVEFVRRPTGGRAVLHHHEMTYAVAMPLRALGGLRRTYHRINQGLVAGVASLGAGVGLARGGAPARLSTSPCFHEPAAGEVTAGGRKLVGSAQVRIGDALLQHGSLILSGHQGALARFGPPGEAVAAPATLEELLGAVPAWDALASALAGGLRGVLGGEWCAGDLDEAELRAMAELMATYASPEWTWRR